MNFDLFCLSAIRNVDMDDFQQNIEGKKELFKSYKKHSGKEDQNEKQELIGWIGVLCSVANSTHIS